jgi:multidrug efflux system membrane fusion protein
VGQAKVVVPMQAIVGRQDAASGYAVYGVEGEGGNAVVRLRPVQLGQVYGDRIQVIQGLRPGERVVVSGPALLHDRQAVRVEPGTSTSTSTSTSVGE